MEPGFKTIAELFAVPQPENVEIAEERAARDGRNAEESDQLGALSLREGDVRTAIRHFQKAIEQRDAGDVASHHNLAGAYSYSEDYSQALRQYQKALKIKSDVAEPLVGVSEIYKRHGRFRDSIVQLEKAIALEPANAYLRIKLAELLRDAGEKRRALTAAQQAVVADPEQSFYHYWIGDLQIQMGLYEDALDSLRAAIELSPGDDYLYLRAAVAFWRADRKPESVKAIRLASDLDPAKNLYHGILEILLREIGLEAEADLEVDRAEKMDSYDNDYLDRLLVEMGLAGR